MCEVVGRSAYVTLDTEVLYSHHLFLYLSNVRNPSQENINSISITTRYDGIVLDESVTDSVLDASFIRTTNEPEIIQQPTIDFYPKNEGEIATYIFNFAPFLDV